MALIEKQQGRREKQTPSGYTRLFGIPALGNLISKVHATCISSGMELEKLIWEKCNKIENLDDFLTKTLHSEEDKIYVATKKQVKKSQKIHSKYEPDFLAFNPYKRLCYIIEVKDGDQFDTKKSSGEHKTLHDFTDDISRELSYSTEIYTCSFNARTRKEIYDGLKHKFSMEELMTGRELCDLFGIDYDEIVKIRTADQQGNLEYFVREILHIPAIKNMIVGLLKNFHD